jgi:hypothetical protein
LTEKYNKYKISTFCTITASSGEYRLVSPDDALNCAIYIEFKLIVFFDDSVPVLVLSTMLHLTPSSIDLD